MARNRAVFEVRGQQQLRKKLSSVGKIAKVEGKQALYEVAEQIADGARDRVPENTSELYDTIRVSEEGSRADGDAGRYQAVVSAGPAISESTGIDYSILVHEGMPEGEKYMLGELSRFKNEGEPHVGKGVGWKFLERSYEEHYRRALSHVSKKIKAGLAVLGVVK